MNSIRTRSLLLAQGRRSCSSGVSVPVQREIDVSISRMGSASLREAAQSLVDKTCSLSTSERNAVASALCDRALSIQSDLQYWDIVSIIQAVGVSGADSTVDVEKLDLLSEVLNGKLSHLSPKHLIDLLAAFEAISYRPKSLYAGIGNRVVDLVRSSIYADELVALMRVMGKHKFANLALAQVISSAVVSNESLHSQLRYMHCCEVVGALAHLGQLDKRLWKLIDARCQRELELMPVMELWSTVTGFSELVFSYRPLELLATEKLRAVIANADSTHFDQVSRPMDLVQFARLRGWLTDDLLIAACKWANGAVYRPATRSQAHRRPTVFEVALLADLCREHGIPSERIEKAVKITITSKAGTESRLAKPKPLRYMRRRVYIPMEDGNAAMGIAPVRDLPDQSLSAVKTSDAAFAPRLRGLTDGVPLWKSRSGPWFTRK